MEGRREKMRKWGDNDTGLPKQNKNKKKMKMNSEKNDGIEAVQLRTLTIPDDVLLDHILPRLPVKTLIRFKSVCKNWYSSISTPEFVKLHLQFSSSRHHFLLHSLFRSKDFFLLPYDEEVGLKEVVKLDCESDHIDRRFVVVGSCNGLICLHPPGDESKNHWFLLWNPATREFGRPIDSPVRGFPYFCGFGYASLTDDYKIVAAYKHGEETEGFDIYIFSLRTGNWKHIGLFKGLEIALEGCILCYGLLVDDTLYWCFLKLGSSTQSVVAGFHLASEQFKEIARTDVSHRYKVDRLYTMKACLLALRINDDEPDGVYTLKQQGDSSSWEKLFSVPPNMGLLLDFSTTGKCLIQEWGTWKLAFADLIGEALEETQAISFNDMVSSVHYVESLVALRNK